VHWSPVNWRPWSQEGTSYPSLLQRNVLNLLNIVISSLLQFTHMNINYATRSSIMLIMPGQKNIKNLVFLISRDC